MAADDVPTPRITCRADGHWAICPDCGTPEEPVEFEVPVKTVPFQDAAGRRRGHTSSHDLSKFERHWRETHA